MLLAHSLWRTVRWPLVVLLVGMAGVVASTIMDEVYSSEWSLTVGAPSVWFLFVGAVWFVGAVVVHFVQNRRAG